MVNWKQELKIYTAKKLKSKLGIDVAPDQIDNIIINIDNIDLSKAQDKELLTLYAFAIMDENFEQAKKISNKFKERNIFVEIKINHADKSGKIIITNINDNNIIIDEMIMKILPDGMIIDFEKQNF